MLRVSCIWLESGTRIGPQPLSANTNIQNVRHAAIVKRTVRLESIEPSFFASLRSVKGLDGVVINTPALIALTAKRESPSLPASGPHDGPGNAFQIFLPHTTIPFRTGRAELLHCRPSSGILLMAERSRKSVALQVVPYGIPRLCLPGVFVSLSPLRLIVHL